MTMHPMAIDMTEVLRLTQAGQLSEALSRLRGNAPRPGFKSGASTGRASSWSAGTKPADGKSADAGVIDMVAPRERGGTWTPPTFTTSMAGGDGRAAPGICIPDFVQTISQRVGTGVCGASLDGVPNLHGLPGVAGLDGLPGLDGFPGVKPRTPAVPLPEGARFEERSFSNEAGTRSYKVYVPSSFRGQACPLVVMLHGCTQSPDDFAAGTRMNELAEEQGFLVVYPSQTRSAHPQRCWKWFSAGDQGRGRGEPSIIAGLTRAVMAEFDVDPARVYVAGMSAGGAAAAIMGSEYPDLYAAVGVHSGLACGSASDLPSALSAMRGGGAVRARGGRKIVPTIVFHGDRDGTVHAKNGEQVIASQLGDDLRAVTARGTSEGGIAYTRTAYSDEVDREWLVHWSVAGGGHAWAGGSPAGSYTDPRGPDASREMLHFFAGHVNEVA